MADPVISPSQKRHGLIFRRRSPSETIITAQFPDPRNGGLPPNNVSIASSHALTSKSDPLPNTKAPPQSPPQHRQHIERAQSSEYFLEVQKRQPLREAQSRRSKFNTTIHTDATGAQPAFESDAFTVEMPTTREPIIERPVFRAKIPKVLSPSKAQVEALETYKKKARQVRERNNSTGVRVPSKLLSYDYAYASQVESSSDPTPLQKYIDSMAPSSPPRYSHSPAGSFPISPPIPQTSWLQAGITSEARDSPTTSPTVVKIQGARSINGSMKSTDSSGTRILGNIASSRSAGQPAMQDHHNFDRHDTASGAICHTSTTRPTKETITARLVPKSTTASTVAKRTRRKEEPQPSKEPYRGLHTSKPSPLPMSSRSPSPNKPTPKCVFTAAKITDTVPGGDAIFGYPNSNITHTPAGSSNAAAAAVSTTTKRVPFQTPSTPTKTRLRQQPSIQTPPRKDHIGILPKKWGAWLRPSGPRIAKPITTTSTPTSPSSYSASAKELHFQRQINNATSSAEDPVTPKKTTTTTTSPPATFKIPTSFTQSTSSTPLQNQNQTRKRGKLARSAPPPPFPSFPVAVESRDQTTTTPVVVPPPPTSAGLPSFDTGLAQISYLFSWLVYICVIVYIAVGVFFVLDGVRRAFLVLSAPFRVVRDVGGGVGKGAVVLGVWVWGMGRAGLE
ncbi:unnamed protein product [Periconia digitata]|uniref:Uncharacterized protein n=1 Tax=Periconia digitata TaxID=1303443 RepID=A0A9W4XMJ8_9PLEO|nr:unnamed protein product [Periconia digitata]